MTQPLDSSTATTEVVAYSAPEGPLHDDRLPLFEEPLDVGQWYWVKDAENSEQRSFCCVTSIGSNFVEFTHVSEASERVHFDDLAARCEREFDPSRVIQDKVRASQKRTLLLMEQISELSARLGVAPSAALGTGNETRALSLVHDNGRDLGAYKAELEAAKAETIPSLFKKIQAANKTMGRWLQAETLPLQAQAQALQSVLDRIGQRIFNVQLYSGLSESIEQIADGEAAPLTEKIRLLQRLCFMDEECLAHYETGGMTFDGIEEFDAWLLRPDNLARLLPFARCIVSFRVRRHIKERSVAGGYINFLQIAEESKTDRYTFLYIRNGAKVYRMRTAIDFGPTLFPDMTRKSLEGRIFAKVQNYSTRKEVEHLLSENEFRELCENYDRAKARVEFKNRENERERAAWTSRKQSAQAAGQEFNEPEPHHWHEYIGTDPRLDFNEFEPKNIFFDDIKKKIASVIEEHNRIVLVLQGLLDRSPVLHPHPPWKLWTQAGFEQALELVYDETRALVAGEKPDFEAYRVQGLASLREGSVVIGQQALWQEEMEERIPDLRRNSRAFFAATEGNPGPGFLAKVERIDRRKGKCFFSWYRRPPYGKNEGRAFRVTFSCDIGQLFHVGAYKPGDFRLFFNDPRSRCDYLKWAEFLLAAEEFHAGNRKVEEPAAPTKRKPASYDSKRAYERSKLRKSFKGNAVRLLFSLSTTGGTTYEAGTLWRVVSTSNLCSIRQIDETGKPLPGGGFVRRVIYSYLSLVEGIPGDP